jgi:hypothetical protein
MKEVGHNWNETCSYRGEWTLIVDSKQEYSGLRTRDVLNIFEYPERKLNAGYQGLNCNH